MNVSLEKAILTKKLCLQDVEVLEPLLTGKDRTSYIPDHLLVKGESAREFVKRMWWTCEFFWSIRLRRDPGQVIGFSMVYNWKKRKKELDIHSFILPAYRDKGVLVDSLKAAKEIARHLLDAEVIHYPHLQREKLLLPEHGPRQQAERPLVNKVAV